MAKLLLIWAMKYIELNEGLTYKVEYISDLNKSDGTLRKLMYVIVIYKLGWRWKFLWKELLKIISEFTEKNLCFIKV